MRVPNGDSMGICAPSEMEQAKDGKRNESRCNGILLYSPATRPLWISLSRTHGSMHSRETKSDRQTQLPGMYR